MRTVDAKYLKKPFNCMLDPETREKLDWLAGKYEGSMSAAIRNAVRHLYDEWITHDRRHQAKREKVG